MQLGYHPAKKHSVTFKRGHALIVNTMRMEPEVTFTGCMENLVASNDPALVGQFQREFEQLWTSLRG